MSNLPLMNVKCEIRSDISLASEASSHNKPAFISQISYLSQHLIWVSWPFSISQLHHLQKMREMEASRAGKKKGGELHQLLTISSQKWKERLLLTLHWPALVTWHQFTNWGRGYKVQRRAGGRHLCHRFYWKAAGSMSVFVCARGFIMKIYLKATLKKFRVFKIKIRKLSVSPFQVTPAPALENR